MVPMDQPQAALDMITTWTRSEGQLGIKLKAQRTVSGSVGQTDDKRSFRGWSIFPTQDRVVISST